MANRKQTQALAISGAAKRGALAIPAGSSALARRAVAALEKEAATIHAAESERRGIAATGFRLISDGGRASAVIRTPEATYEIEGGSIAVTSHV